MTEPEEFNDAIEWIDVNFEPDDFNTFDEYLQAIRNEFDNDNLINAIQGDIEDLFFEPEPTELERIESDIESTMTSLFD